MPLFGLALTEVRECDDVARVGRRSRLIGNPHLDAGDVDARQQVRQLLHGSVVMLAEIARQEEVAVLLVVGDIDLKGSELRAAL